MPKRNKNKSAALTNGKAPSDAKAKNSEEAINAKAKTSVEPMDIKAKNSEGSSDAKAKNSEGSSDAKAKNSEGSSDAKAKNSEGSSGAEAKNKVPKNAKAQNGEGPSDAKVEKGKGWYEMYQEPFVGLSPADSRWFHAFPSSYYGPPPPETDTFLLSGPVELEGLNATVMPTYGRTNFVPVKLRIPHNGQIVPPVEVLLDVREMNGGSKPGGAGADYPSLRCIRKHVKNIRKIIEEDPSKYLEMDQVVVDCKMIGKGESIREGKVSQAACHPGLKKGNAELEDIVDKMAALDVGPVSSAQDLDD